MFNAITTAITNVFNFVPNTIGNEDGDGNVYNKKTYEDLRRQGLI